MKLIIIILFFLSSSLFPYESNAKSGGELSSWNEPYKSRIIDFVKSVTLKGSKSFVPRIDRIAAIDLDGTVISERPEYFHGFISKRYLLEKLKKNPELIENPIYLAVKNRDKAFLRKNLSAFLLESFAGESVKYINEFALKTFENSVPKKAKVPYKKLWYFPMAELIEYLKVNGFKVYILSTAQQDLIRVAVVKYLKIPGEQVIGTLAAYKVSKKDDTVRRIKKVWYPICHGRGKVLRFLERTGKTPILGAGNSTNDISFLNFVDQSPFLHLNLVIDHDDKREYIYKKQKILDASQKNGWVVVSMAKGFKKIYGDISFMKWGAGSKPEVDKSGKSKNPIAILIFGILGLFLILGGSVVVMGRKKG